MQIVIWTARIAVFLYLLGLLTRLTQPRKTSTKILWTAGFLVFVVHIWAAFEFVHHWSHTAAWKQTAEQTEQLCGWYWGGGIWFNYLFLLVWGIDVGLLWATINAPWWKLVLNAYMIFIVVNATAVFGPSWWIPVMIVAGLMLGFLVWHQSGSPTAHNKTTSHS
ncbi:MAG: hypothetical protein HUJ26_20260 [Planctomycetaceae bacterium]|nr:hypothetical protein [Planctomycetaceae bacterium]